MSVSNTHGAEIDKMSTELKRKRRDRLVLEIEAVLKNDYDQKEYAKIAEKVVEGDYVIEFTNNRGDFLLYERDSERIRRKYFPLL